MNNPESARPYESIDSRLPHGEDEGIPWDPDINIVELLMRDLPEEFLTPEQEKECSRRIQEGNIARDRFGRATNPDELLRLDAALHKREEAIDTLCSHNIRLAIANAKNFQGRGVEFLDLIQAGMDGLLHAAHTFDWKKDTRFSTYATWWIQQRIYREIANNSRMIRLPVHAHDALKRMRRVTEDYLQEHGVAPDEKTLATLSKTPVSIVRRLLRVQVETVSLDESRVEDDDDSATLMHMLQDPGESVETRLIREEENREMLALIRNLPAREAQVLLMRTGHYYDEPPMTLQEVGNHLGITRERARQLEVSGARRLQAMRKAGGKRGKHPSR